MAKLAAKDRKKVEKADAVTGGDFQPMPPGKYIATLNGVEAKASSAGNPMWVAEFHEIHNLDGEKQPGRLWNNMMLPTTDTPPDDYTKGAEKWEQYQSLSAGRIKAFFEAFGYDVDSDTDELIGEQCVIQVGIRTIQSGERAGQKTNQINGVFPLDSVPASAGGTGDGASDDDF